VAATVGENRRKPGTSGAAVGTRSPGTAVYALEISDFHFAVETSGEEIRKVIANGSEKDSRIRGMKAK